MTKLRILLVFISLFWYRWISWDSPLPDSWTPESRVRFTATIMERPEYTDSKTIIRKEIWEIKIKGYAVIIPGSRVEFVGTVIPKVLMGNPTKIVMTDPTFEVMERLPGDEMRMTERLMVQIGEWREKWVSILEKTLPSPMSSLAAGILLGVKGQMPYEFYQQLVSTGTLHIVAASGFNVMIVASVLMTVAKKFFRRGAAIGVGIGGILFYVLLSGASASVVRAGIMGSLTLIAYYFGRPAEAKRLLWITAMVMTLYNPLMIIDIGFQLSLMATAGLLYLEPVFKRLPQYKFVKEYLYPTLAATIATLPIIWWHFGRISWISPIVNMLVLPMVPLIMLLSALTVVLGQPMAWILYPPLAWVVWVIGLFG